MPKSYSEMTASEVYQFLNNRLPQEANVYEIGCGKKSAIALKDLMDAGRVNSYQGKDISEKSVKETKAQGLEAEVVQKGFNHIPGFQKVAKKRNGALVMMGLPEVALDDACEYAQKAMDAGLHVISYPELG